MRSCNLLSAIVATPWKRQCLLLVIFFYIGYANSMPDKRAPFSSWAGKRSMETPMRSKVDVEDLIKLILQDTVNLENELEGYPEKWLEKRAPFSSWAGKRAPFSSWAGKKRSSEEITNEHGEPRYRFKRNLDEDEEMHEINRRATNSFSAWGGKRSQLRRFARNAPIVPVRVLRPQRAAFSAWGG